MAGSWVDLAVAASSGLAAGYFTNNIAIRFLFWPTEPKVWLLGYQGVFPKKQGELAKVVGAKLSTQVLPKDEIVKQLSSPQLKAQINTEFQRLIQDFLFTQFVTVDDLLRHWMKDQDTRSRLQELVANWISDALKSVGESQKAEQILSDLLREQAFAQRDKTLGELLPADAQSVVRSAQRALINWAQSSGAKFIHQGCVEWLSSNQPLQSVVPNVSERDIENVLDQASSWLIEALQATLSRRDVQSSLISWLDEQISLALEGQNQGVLGVLKQFFLKKGWAFCGDRALQSVKAQLPDAIESLPKLIEDNKPALIKNIHTYLQRFLRKPIGDVWKQLPQDTQETALRALEKIIHSPNLWEIVERQMSKAWNSILGIKVGQLLPLSTTLNFRERQKGEFQEFSKTEFLEDLALRYKIVTVYSEAHLERLRKVLGVPQDTVVVVPSHEYQTLPVCWSVSKDLGEDVVLVLLSSHSPLEYTEFQQKHSDAAIYFYDHETAISQIQSLEEILSSGPLLACEMTNKLSLSVSSGGFYDHKKSSMAKLLRIQKMHRFSYIKHSELSFDGWDILKALAALNNVNDLDFPDRMLIAFESKDPVQISNAVGLQSLRLFIRGIEHEEESSEQGSSLSAVQGDPYVSCARGLIALLVQQDLKLLADSVMSSILQMKVGALGAYVAREKAEILSNQLADTGFDLLKDHGATIASSLDISGIVEDRIKELSPEEVGESVRAISGSAFWSLEFFGAFLGLLVSLIIACLYSVHADGGFAVAATVAFVAVMFIGKTHERTVSFFSKRERASQLEDIRKRHKEE